MKTRLLSSIVFVLIIAIAFILKFYVSNYFFDVLILLIGIITSYEASKLFTKIGKFNDKYMATIFPGALMLTFLLGIISDDEIGISFTISIAVAVLLVCSLITFLIPFLNYKRTKIELKARKMNTTVVNYSFNKALNTTIIFIYPALLITFLTLINHFEDLTTSFSGLTNLNGYISLYVLLFAFLVPIFTDTFAYITGGLFGGKKLAPSISPNKRISGCIGGLFWCVLLSVTVFCIFNAVPYMAELFSRTGITLWKIAIISAIGSIIGQAGDLFESFIKRKANVKDSGNIMPGHGGMLDRFDSHIFVAPFIFIAFSIIFVLI